MMSSASGDACLCAAQRARGVIPRARLPDVAFLLMPMPRRDARLMPSPTSCAIALLLSPDMRVTSEFRDAITLCHDAFHHVCCCLLTPAAERQAWLSRAVRGLCRRKRQQKRQPAYRPRGRRRCAEREAATRGKRRYEARAVLCSHASAASCVRTKCESHDMPFLPATCSATHATDSVRCTRSASCGEANAAARYFSVQMRKICVRVKYPRPPARRTRGTPSSPPAF